MGTNKRGWDGSKKICVDIRDIITIPQITGTHNPANTPDSLCKPQNGVLYMLPRAHLNRNKGPDLEV